MAQLSLGESKWRMVRRVLRKKKFQYDDARNQSRFDKGYFEWLVEKGFFQDLGEGWYTLTERGKAAAELGFYEI